MSNARDIWSPPESKGYDSWSPLDTRPPPLRIWGKAALILVFSGFFIAALMWLIGTFADLPLGDTDMPAVLGTTMACVMVAMARLRRRRDWLAVGGGGLLAGLGGLALTVLAALGLAWADRAGAGYPPALLTDFVLATLTIFLVYRFAVPWYERNGLLAREDWMGVPSGPKQAGDDEGDTP